MYNLNTFYPTIVYNDYLIDPSIMKYLLPETDKKRRVVLYDYTNKRNIYHTFVRDICSDYLQINHFDHNKSKWYMDVIRYQLDNDTNKSWIPGCKT